MSSSLTYFVTGANRGIGKGFVASLLQRPNTTVIATVRDVAASFSVLTSLPKAPGSTLIILKLDASSETDPKTAIASLKANHPTITSIDIVIANAGIGHSGTTVSETTPESFREHIDVNTLGPILLFQAIKPLLQASTAGNPIFLAMSTMIASMGLQPNFSFLPPKFSPYGASKAALNWVVCRMHVEEPWLTSYVVHPGMVLTDMSERMELVLDLKSIGAITVEESVEGVLSGLDRADRKVSGTFQNQDGTVSPW